MTKVINNNNLLEEKFVDVEVIKENWNTYETEDGSIIKQKYLISFIIDTGEKDEEGKSKYWFANNSITTVYSPKKIRGPPDKNYPVNELEKYIIQPNVKFRQIFDGGNNEYKTEKFLIILRNIVKKIDKTNKFDQKGNIQYIVRSEIEILLSEITSE